VKPTAILGACCIAPILLWVHPAVAQRPASSVPSNPSAAARPASASSGNSTDLTHSGRAALDLYLDQTAERYLADRAERVGSLRTLAEAETYRENIRKRMFSLIGKLPERTPLKAKTLGETDAGDFRIRKVIFESQPNFPVTALLYVPASRAPGQKRPAILMTPGHAPAGKASDAGTAAIFARNGFVVLSYDPIGEGERLQYPDPARLGVTLAARPPGSTPKPVYSPCSSATPWLATWSGMRCAASIT
jgi:hypothetical protein